MIIGCLGKGGSGKSTVATLLTKTLAKQGHQVLAIDADHNMDLSFNLGVEKPETDYLGTGLPDLLAFCGLSEGEKYPEVFFKDTFPSFSFTNKDAFSKRYVSPVDENISVLIAGPHTEKVLHGAYCSHSLVTPLKVYLPFLNLNEKEFVIVDEKAGADGAGAGISTGFDVACVVVEPTRHGIKAAQQICKLLDYYKTPYVIIGNKALTDQDEDMLSENLHEKPLFVLRMNESTRSANLTEKIESHMLKLMETCKNLSKQDRKERSIEKFTRNKEYVQKK